MRYGFRVAVLFAVQLIFIAAAVLAQTGNSGSIEGTVLDPSGRTVADATVEITNVVSVIHAPQTRPKTALSASPTCRLIRIT